MISFDLRKSRTKETTIVTQQRPLNREEAARYLRDNYGFRCKTATLAKYATLGGGPKFRKAGRYPTYALEDLNAWAEDRLSDKVSSTSELEAAA
jgi:hypothetical protein